MKLSEIEPTLREIRVRPIKTLGQNFLHDRGVIDRIVPEPVGGAHRAPEVAIQALGDAIAAELEALSGLPRDALLSAREEKFLGMGRV